MKSITLKQASDITLEDIDTIRKRVKRSGIPTRYAHGELTFPWFAAMPTHAIDLVARQARKERAKQYIEDAISA